MHMYFFPSNFVNENETYEFLYITLQPNLSLIL